jgi:cytochrome c551/c552
MKRPALCVVPAVVVAAICACGPSTPDALFVDLGCPRCHGQHLEGNRYGPPLTDIGPLWDSDETLAAYLRDPKSAIADHPRLKQARQRYGLMMLPVTTASDEQIRNLAHWLRGQQQEP